MISVPVVNSSKHPLPTYETAHAAAIDIRVNLERPVVLESLGRATLSTGLRFALPVGYELQIRSRSGLTAKHGIAILNSPGTIDADYRGELKLIVVNLSHEPYTIEDGDRMAQAVVGPVSRIAWQPVETLDDTVRGEGGLGSTGR